MLLLKHTIKEKGELHPRYLSVFLFAKGPVIKFDVPPFKNVVFPKLKIPVLIQKFDLPPKITQLILGGSLVPLYLYSNMVLLKKYRYHSILRQIISKNCP